MIRRALVCALVSAVLPLSAADPGPSLSGMHWRLIGPNRSGRVWTVAGVPGDPATYYIGTPAGALWKTTSGGTTWRAVSDSMPVTGFGAVAVAGSNPNVVYAGTGNNTLGAGVFRSTDAGVTWTQAGLADTKYITALLVHPRNADVVLAGVGSGGNFGSMVFYNNNPSPARGVYRTADGGRTWTHVLFVNDATSVVDVVQDPSAPDVVFASVAQSGAAEGAPIFVSHDAGVTWKRLEGAGLPAPANAANVAVAPNTLAKRLYALVGGRRSGGLYRSTDGGETWTLGTTRLASAGGHLYVDPRNHDVVYTMGTSVYRSSDGGASLQAIKGAPGGDDPHAMWIDPTNPRRMIVGADQGPTISMDGGATWTPWYAVQNGEFYYVSTDNGFPYRVYSAQQDSGTVSIASRSDYGAIRPSDWFSVSGYEEGRIFDDPLNPRFVYTHGGGHTIVRFDRETGQSGPVYTPAPGDRFGPRPGMALSPKDPRWMFVGAQYVLASNDRVTWNRISPDLTATSGNERRRQGNPNIVALAASPLDASVLWAGTSNGLLHVTRDRGASWNNVTPPRLTQEPALTIWSIDASPHDAATAYVGAIDLSDRHAPCLLMTRDFGRTWREIDDGLPVDVPTRVVREDPEREGLLYAGTQAGVFVSFDRGGQWVPLQLDLPRVAINDISVHGTDLVVATWGRGLWILDDVSPLRQMNEARNDPAPAHLFAPRDATRVRWDVNQDTPLPPEVLTGENAPDGAVLYYSLREPARSAVTISIRDQGGAIVREFTSASPAPDTRMPNVPEYWFAKPQTVETTPGLHRLVWDLRYPTPPSLDYDREGNPSDTVSYGIVAPAVLGRSPRQQPIGPLVLPGTYSVTLTADRGTVTRPLRVVNDPRSPATGADLGALLGSERMLTAGVQRSHAAIEQLRELRALANARETSTAPAAIRDAISAFDAKALSAITALADGRTLAEQLASLEFADLKPTASTVAAIEAACGDADKALDVYRRTITQDLATVNAAMAGAHLRPVAAPPVVTGAACGAR
jgi:photosystem II stability/assembly factor-like uncharacterized protein